MGSLHIRTQNLTRDRASDNARDAANITEIMHERKNYKTGFTDYKAFVLHGDAAFDYNYSASSRKMISSAFNAMANTPHADGAGIFRTALIIMRKIMGVTPASKPETFYTGGIYVPDNKPFPKLEPGLSVSVSYQDKKEFITVWDADNKEYRGVNWLSQRDYLMILNLDIPESLNALKLIRKYGYNDVIDMALLASSVTYRRFGYKQNPYYPIIRQAITENNHATGNVIMTMLRNQVIKGTKIDVPSYDDLKTMPVIPEPILEANIDMGDYDAAAVKESHAILDSLDSMPDVPETERKTLYALLTSDETDYAHNTKIFLSYRGSLDNVNTRNEVNKYCRELIKPENTDNWSRLDKVLGARPWFEDDCYTHDVLDLLPWHRHGNHYEHEVAARFLTSVVSNDDKTSRLVKWLDNRSQLSGVWSTANGYGYGQPKSFSFKYRMSKAKPNRLVPRTYTDSRGVEHSLNDYYLVRSSKQNPVEVVIPPEIVHFIDTGVVPETLTVSSYWTAHKFKSYEDNAKGNRRGVLERKSHKYLPRTLTFKLRTNETEADWETWSAALSD